MTKMLLGCALLCLAAGCASARPVTLQKRVKVVELSDAQRDATLSPDKTYICEEGARTGSKMPTAICQTVADREREREAAQDAVHRMMQAGYRR